MVPLAGTTWTTVVSAPATDRQRAVGGLSCWNRDTVAHAISLRLLKGAVETLFHPPVTIGPGQKHQFIDGGLVALDATDESLEMKSDAAATTTEPLVLPAWLENAV